jgi:hypothetical protein
MSAVGFLAALIERARGGAETRGFGDARGDEKGEPLAPFLRRRRPSRFEPATPWQGDFSVEALREEAPGFATKLSPAPEPAASPSPGGRAGLARAGFEPSASRRGRRERRATERAERVEREVVTREIVTAAELPPAPPPVPPQTPPRAPAPLLAEASLPQLARANAETASLPPTRAQRLAAREREPPPFASVTSGVRDAATPPPPRPFPPATPPPTPARRDAPTVRGAQAWPLLRPAPPPILTPPAAALAWTRAGQPSPRAAARPPSPPSPPPVQISIGRIEVRAAAPTPPSRRAAALAGPRLSLDDYLRARGGRR